MTIDEAIEIKEGHYRGDEPDNPYDLMRADRLSYEALKRVRDYKKAHIGLHYTPISQYETAEKAYFEAITKACHAHDEAITKALKVYEEALAKALKFMRRQENNEH